MTDPIVADQGGCALSGRTVSCDLGTVATGGTVTVTIPFTVDAGSTATSLTNTATATSPTPDPDAANNTSTDTTPVTPAADLALTKTGPRHRRRRRGAALGVRRRQRRTVGRRERRADRHRAGRGHGRVRGPSHGSCAVDRQLITCTIGALPAGDVRHHADLPSAAPSTPASPADLNGQHGDGDLADAEPDPGRTPDGRSATAVTTVTTSADVSVMKAATAPRRPRGSRASWTLMVRNNGPSTARAVVGDRRDPGRADRCHLHRCRWNAVGLPGRGLPAR